MVAAQCHHRHVIIDHITDTEVCSDCGFVFQERPSLDIDPGTADRRWWCHGLPKATRECLSRFATILGVSANQYMDACRRAIDNNASARHPATLAAYILESPGVDISVRDAAHALDIPRRFLSRAVARVRAMRIQK